MIRRSLSRIDPMVRLLVIALLLASFLPVSGDALTVARTVTSVAIFLLFFLNGMRLPRAEVMQGIANWRFLLPLTAWVFGAMMLAGWGLSLAVTHYLPPLVALGFLYLGALPSTVQSAPAYSSMAGGNVASSVVAAAILNLLGVFITAPLFSVMSGVAGTAVGGDGLVKVILIILLPFALGQIFQRWGYEWVLKNRGLISRMDRIPIAIAVYVAFSGAVVQGIWEWLTLGEWAILLGGVAAMLFFGFYGAWIVGRILRFKRIDGISFLFAGAQKSLALGAPLAAVLFSPEMAGLLLIPLLVYHFFQLLLSAPLALRFARG